MIEQKKFLDAKTFHVKDGKVYVDGENLKCTEAFFTQKKDPISYNMRVHFGDGHIIRRDYKTDNYGSLKGEFID